jgi:hypothetical protein
LISEGRIRYLLEQAEEGAHRTGVTRQLARGVQQLAEEVRTLRGRLEAADSVLEHAFRVEADRGYLMLSEALRGHAPVEASEEETALWAKYFDNEQNRGYGLHVPPVDFRDSDRMLVLRCNRCIYLVGGWVHAEWHEKQIPEVSEQMMEQRKEKFGER